MDLLFFAMSAVRSLISHLGLAVGTQETGQKEQNGGNGSKCVRTSLSALVASRQETIKERGGRRVSFSSSSSSLHLSSHSSFARASFLPPSSFPPGWLDLLL